MFDPAAIGAAATAVKTAKELFSEYKNSKAKQKLEPQIREVLGQLDSVQDTLFKLRKELHRLQDENRDLTKHIDEKEIWETRLANYKITNTAGRAVVYQSQSGPFHYACPNCINDEQIQILQDMNVVAGTYKCPKCQSSFPIDRITNDEPISFEPEY